MRVIAERGAYAIPRLFFGSGPGPGSEWVTHAPEELVATMAPLDQHVMLNVDALVAIVAPENTRDGADIEPERLQLTQSAAPMPVMERMVGGEVPWVGCQYPTPRSRRTRA